MKTPERHKTPSNLQHEFGEYQNFSVNMHEGHIDGLLTDSREEGGLDAPSAYL